MSPLDVATLAAIAALLVLSALFSGAETAFTGASRAFITRRARAGDARAGRLAALRERKDRLLAALLLGNNLVNTTATALAAGLLIAWFGDQGVAYASVAMTLILVILSEVLPKTWAISHPERAALAATPMLVAALRVFGPPAAAVNAAVRSLLALGGVRVGGERAQSEEELMGAIALHGEGTDEAAAVEERRMLRGVLALDDLTVADVMTHRSRIEALDADQPPAESVRRLLATRHGVLPLWREGGRELVGLIDTRAALRALHAVGGDPSRLDLGRLAEPAPLAPETRPLLDQLQLFRRSRRHLALVVDEYGQIEGLVTLHDVMEVVVGEITEAGETILADAVKGAGEIEVPGETRVRDLNRELDWALPEEEAMTVAGLLMAAAKGLPRRGEPVAVAGYRLIASDVRGRRIARVKIIAPEPPPAGA
ncbi:MAG: CNNM domain-containing protein [Elioraea sp.]|nr:CNNM domain-containing protein [Elioraea sp.]